MAFEFVEVKLLRAICRFLPYVIASTVRCAAIRFSFKGFTDSFALCAQNDRQADILFFGTLK